MKRKELDLRFIDALNMLKELNIKPIIFYGSLLGYTRENDFIEGDNDIDFLISKEDMDTLKRSHYCREKHIIGYFLKNKHYTLENIPYMNIRFSSGIVDFYQYTIIEDKFVIEWEGNVTFKKDDILPFIPVQFKNEEIYIPNKPENVVSDMYGDNWKIPLPATTEGYDFLNFTKAPNNMKEWRDRVSKEITPKILNFSNGKIKFR